ncbi:MAG TPA: hypothetical protein P5132_10935, partial [Bacteroidales bacterium]|nr:hypothetical protein [Bacteroidales bacterium]
MNKRLHTLKYIFFDFAASAASWTFFYIFRKLRIESEKFGYDIDLEFSSQYYWALLIIPTFWLFLYYLSGYYKDIYRKSRLK